MRSPLSKALIAVNAPLAVSIYKALLDTLLYKALLADCLSNAPLAVYKASLDILLFKTPLTVCILNAPLETSDYEAPLRLTDDSIGAFGFQQ